MGSSSSHLNSHQEPPAEVSHGPPLTGGSCGSRADETTCNSPRMERLTSKPPVFGRRRRGGAPLCDMLREPRRQSCSSLEELGFSELPPEMYTKRITDERLEQHSAQEVQGKRDSERNQEISSSFDQILDVEESQEDMFLGPTGPIKPEMIDKNRKIYRAHFPMAGFYQWPDIGLGFSVENEVTIDIEFASWNQHLDCTQQQALMIAGPLFNIRVIDGIVTSVHLPHFIDLQGGKVDVSLFRIAHFKDEGMVLENPTRVESCHAILESPSFSPIGVLLRFVHSTFRFIPIYSTTLIYGRLSGVDITLHLYLIPSDCTIRKAIDKEESKFQFSRLNKPPPVDPLYVGSHFLVSGSKQLEIKPKKLELCYRSAGECQVYSEIYSSNVKEGISLDLSDEKGTVVWETLLRSGDLRFACASASTAFTGKDLINQLREQLVNRVTSVDILLDKLYLSVLNKEEYDIVRAESTSQSKMRKLLSFCSSWNDECKHKFFRSLKEVHPYLWKDLLPGGNTADSEEDW